MDISQINLRMANDNIPPPLLAPIPKKRKYSVIQQENQPRISKHQRINEAGNKALKKKQ